MLNESVAVLAGICGILAQSHFVIYRILLGANGIITVAQCLLLVAINVALIAVIKLIIVGMHFFKIDIEALVSVLAIAACAIFAFAMFLLAFQYASIDEVRDILMTYYRDALWYYTLIVG